MDPKKKLLPAVLLFALLAGSGTGCGLFKEEKLDLAASVVKGISDASPDHSDDAIKRAVEAAIGTTVKALEVKLDQAKGEITSIKATLPSVASEGGMAAGEAAVEKLANNPTTAGIGAAALAAIAAFTGAIARRSAARSKAKGQALGEALSKE